MPKASCKKCSWTTDCNFMCMVCVGCTVICILESSSSFYMQLRSGYTELYQALLSEFLPTTAIIFNFLLPKFYNLSICMCVWYLNTDAISKSDHVISGQIAVGHQYHFHLETHACLCVPEEEGYTVYSSTQWTSNVQTAVAGVLGIPNNK